ncbi:MAG: hypothetical protein P1U44_10950 [Vicingaceae bacterium]|nr:hypothetical protein [Vicingaceae bacterium]
MNYTKAYKTFIDELDVCILTPDNIREEIKRIYDNHYDAIKADSEQSLKYFNLEYELIHISKSITGGFKPNMSGTNVNDEGEEVEVIWPDFREYDEESFTYFLERFTTTKNLMLKYQYGLMSYINGDMKHNDLKQKLIKSLIDCANHVLAIKKDAKHKYKYTHVIIENYRSAFEIAVKANFKDQIKDILLFLYDKYEHSDINEESTFSFFYLLFDLFSNYFKEYKNYISLDDLLQKIYSDAQKQIQVKDLSDAEILLKKALIVAQKNNAPIKTQIQKEIGATLESKADKEIGNGNYFGCQIYAEAALFYKEAGASQQEQEVLKKYEDSRGKIKLEHYRSKLTEEESQDLNNWIENLIEKNNPGLLIHLLTLKSNIQTIAEIKAISDPVPKHFLSSFASPQLLDKYGNTVERYETDEQRMDYRFWEHFSHNLQLSEQIAFATTIRAIEKRVLNSNMIIGFLKVSWLNEPITRQYQNSKHIIIPNDIIIPPVAYFFHCLEESIKKESKVSPQDFVAPIDSMIIKIETILRFACERLGINRTIMKPSSNKFMVPKAKTLGHLFSNLVAKGVFDEKDIALFEYLFIRPEHTNIRNEVCHGLFDLYEYNPRTGLKVLGCIIRLSMLSFESSNE